MAAGMPTGGRASAASRLAGMMQKAWESITLRIMLIAVVAALTVSLVVEMKAHSGHSHVDLGGLSGWLQGIGSLAAVIVALGQTYQLHAERIRELRHQEEQQRTQVFGWIAYRADGSGPGDWQVYLNNMTPMPIGVWVLHVDDAETGRHLALDVTRMLPILPGFSHRPAGVGPGDLLRPTCQLEFADAVGVCWRRDSGGMLRKIPEIRLGDQVLAATATPAGASRDR